MRMIVDRSNRRIVNLVPFEASRQSYILACKHCSNLGDGQHIAAQMVTDPATRLIMCDDCHSPMALVIRVNIVSQDGMIWGDGNMIVRQYVSYADLRDYIEGDKLKETQ